MTVLVFQHAEPESPGLIAEVLAERRIELAVVRTFAGEVVPASLDGFDAVVAMGGPMGVYEARRYPFLSKEIRLLRDAIRDGIPVLGVCLGSQLLATALGAKVSPGRKEIGWFPISLSAAAASDPVWTGVTGPIPVLHWHGDAYPLPKGSDLLASSALTPCQAFRHGETAYGLLFHIEVDDAIVSGMVATFAHELDQAGVRGTDLVDQATHAIPALRATARLVFGRWADRIASPRNPA